MKQLKSFFFPATGAVLLILIYAVFPLLFTVSFGEDGMPDTTELQERQAAIHFATRLILVLYLATILYIEFKEKMRFHADMQRLFYKGTINSLFMSVCAATGVVIATLIETGGSLGDNIFSAILGSFVQFLKTGMIYVVPILALIYFHPNNSNKRKKKQ